MRLLAVLLLLCASLAQARDLAVRHEFRKLHPCPATGLTTGPCRNFEVDHIKALCLGGLDDVENMQWLTVAEHRRKTREDVAACRLARRAGLG